jgi:hypothetical protein
MSTVIDDGRISARSWIAGGNVSPYASFYVGIECRLDAIIVTHSIQGKVLSTQRE